MSTPVDGRITPSLHPINVSEIDGYDEETAPVLAPTLNAFDEAYQGIAKVHDARAAAAQNPAWTAAQQLIQTDDLAQRQLMRLAKGFDATRANLEKGIAHLEQELTAPVEAKAAHPIAAEIRAHAKALNLDQRMTLIREAIASGDHQVATSILGAPAFLSGMLPEMQRVLLREYREQHNPQAAKRLKAMRGARDLIEQRATLIFGELEKAVGAPPHKVKALREAKTAAEKHFVMQDRA